MLESWALVVVWLVLSAGLPPNATVCTLDTASSNVEATRTVPFGKSTNGSEYTRMRFTPTDVSLNTPNVEIRLIAPHTLVYTGMRWHVRAYCEKNRQYRDFVLSRLRGEPDLLDESPNTRELDEDWNTEVPIIFAPDGRLNAAQQAIIETDFGMTEGTLVVASRKALVKYVLRRYQVDPRNQATNPEAQQIVVTNLKELRPWLMHD
mgnify:CR=1 FL=1